MEARNELTRRNISGVPTFLIGEDVVVGLDKAKILELVDHRLIECEECHAKLRVPINKVLSKLLVQSAKMYLVGNHDK